MEGKPCGLFLIMPYLVYISCARIRPVRNTQKAKGFMILLVCFLNLRFPSSFCVFIKHASTVQRVPFPNKATDETI